jgi:cytochrome P450
MVRIAPDRLLVDGSIAFPQIFGRRPNESEFGKVVEFYGPERIGMFSALREDHRRQRRLMAHAFSESALTEQEGYIKKYVDLFISRLKEKSASTGVPADMTRWFNYFTFDVIGELAFGDPFYSLEKSNYHPWVAMIFQGIKGIGLVLFFVNYPLLKPLILLIGGQTLKIKKQSTQLAVEKTNKRIALGTETRKDFMTQILRNNKDGQGMSHREILVNAEGLIVAGSETTATALSGLMFHLGQNPEVYRILAEEVRGSWTSEEEITMRSTAPLQYLHACLEETLRMYPPAGEIPPRISPGAVINGQYIPKGVGHKGGKNPFIENTKTDIGVQTYITISAWATFHSARNFTDPEQFKPQRFLPQTHPLYETRYAGDNKASFKPFSAGPRDCIGKNLAYAEMRLSVTRLLWNFDIKLEPGQDDWVDKQRSFVVYEKPPLMIKLHPRVGA